MFCPLVACFVYIFSIIVWAYYQINKFMYTSKNARFLDPPREYIDWQYFNSKISKKKKRKNVLPSVSSHFLQDQNPHPKLILTFMYSSKNHSTLLTKYFCLWCTVNAQWWIILCLILGLKLTLMRAPCSKHCQLYFFTSYHIHS